MSSKSIILFGAGSPLIVDYEEICFHNHIEIQAIVINLVGIECFAQNRQKIIDISEINYSQSTDFICPLFTPINRFQATQEALSYSLKPYGLLCSKQSILPKHFSCGNACFINSGVVLGACSKIGNHILINRGACLGHHLFLDDYVSIGPGVTIGGNVQVGRGTLIGAGAVILPSIQIGRHAVIGAGSVVTKNVDNNTVVVGNPAKTLKVNHLNF